MKRRQFIKTLSAAATAPMMPLKLAAAPIVSAAQYAKAVEAANIWAYLTTSNLKHTLGVDAATAQAVMDQLKANGMIGATGSGGITLTRKYVADSARIAAKAVKSVHQSTSPNSKIIDTAKDVARDRAEEASDPEAEEAPAHPAALTTSPRPKPRPTAQTIPA